MPRERLPRQSGGSATPSPSAVTAPTTISGTGLQTSSLATTSGLLSSSASSAPASSTASPKSAALTTTSSSAETTSTSQPTSTSPSSTSSSTTSHTPTSSSSSIAPQTTSSAHSSSSSVPPSTTTQPPTSSSSQPGTPTTITSVYTTNVNGSQVLTQTTIPSTIPEISSPSSSDRTAIIAGSAAGGTALIILLLSLAFFARRKRFKRLDFLDAITTKRKQAHSRATLLDLDDVDLEHPPRGYTDYETPWDGNARALMMGTGTRHASGTGSASREDVWSPPNEGTRLMDPLANRDDLDLDLGRIVDDVMGPSATAGHFSDRSISSVYRGSVVESEDVVHSRTVSTASNAALLDAAGLVGTSTVPVRPSPLAQPGTKPGSVGHQSAS